MLNEIIDEIIKRNNKHKSKFHGKINTELLKDRDCSVCKNLYCPSLVEYPLEQERCPICTRRLTKTVSGSNLFVENV